MLSTIQSGRAAVVIQSPPRFAAFGWGLLSALLVFFAIGAAQPASAQEMLRSAKQAQQVGEQLDGYLALVDESASAKIKKMIENTNNLRKDRYQKVASMRGATLESVGEQAAEIIFKRAVPGDMLQTADGKWKKKD
jgi:uncharacterized protein YdbL (DUF1318 family)